MGDVDFAPLLRLLDEGFVGGSDGQMIKYDGFVGCEYKPSTEMTEDSLGWARQWLRT